MREAVFNACTGGSCVAVELRLRQLVVLPTHPVFRIFKDAGLYCRKFTTTDADLIFTSVRDPIALHCAVDVKGAHRLPIPHTAQLPGPGRHLYANSVYPQAFPFYEQVKAKGAKRISFDAFEQALEKVAARKGTSLPEVAAVIVAAGGPKASGTRAQACRFYDDKSNW